MQKKILVKKSQCTILNVFSLIVLIISASFTVEAKIQEIAPPSWWAGMKEPSLQLLIRGSKIGQYHVKIKHQGVSIESQDSLENTNYLALNIHIAKNTKPGIFSMDFYLDGNKEFSYPYQLNVRDGNSSKRIGFNSSDVIYLITPDRFANGDSTNDEVSHLTEGLDRANKDGRHGGDIQGVIDNLGYLSELGITQLWLNPVLENNQAKYSYHGYSTTDYYKVDRRYGTNNLYKQLSIKAKDKGIGLIKDIILNHIGSRHPWMDDLPSSDWINNNAKFIATSHKRESLHDPHAVPEDKKAFVDGWFVPSMPDLNQRNSHLANYLIQNSIWWIEYADLSGIRLDTYSYPDKNFLSDYTQRIMDEYPNFNMVGEEWSVNPAIVSYWQRGKKRRDGYHSDLPSLFDFPLQDALINALKEKETWGTGLTKLYQALANDFLYSDPYNLLVFTDNHDMSRVFTQLDEDIELLKMALTYSLTTRGVGQIFYGTEVLMKHPGTDSHGDIRADFPGGWEGDTANGFNEQGLSKQQKNFKKWLKKLLNWRKNNKTIHKGSLFHYAPKDGVYAYFRKHSDKLIMVIMNKNTQAKNIDLLSYKTMLADRLKGKNTIVREAISGHRLDYKKGLLVNSKSALILEFE